jgi:hypothetical protein
MQTSLFGAPGRISSHTLRSIIVDETCRPRTRNLISHSIDVIVYFSVFEAGGFIHQRRQLYGCEFSPRAPNLISWIFTGTLWDSL